MMLHKVYRKVGRKVIEKMPLSVFRLLVRRDVLGINYHTVSDQKPAHVKHLFPYKTVSMFEDDLMFLKEYCRVIKYDEMTGAHRAKHHNSIVLTFDDGYTECYSTVMPLLTKYDVPCIFFIITDCIDNRFLTLPNKISLCVEKMLNLEDDELERALRRFNSEFSVNLVDYPSFVQWTALLQFTDNSTVVDSLCHMLEIDSDGYLARQKPFLTAEEIKQLASRGYTIGAHTRRHPHLFRLKHQGKMAEEIVESCNAIRELTGQKQVPFAFPFSGDHVDRDFLHELVSRHDFIGLVFDMRELRRDRDFIVNRIAADTPAPQAGRGSNLPRLLYHAYRRHLEQAVAIP